MTLSVDLYWSFRSPYSYLATARVVAMAAQYDVAVNVRPIYPLAVREPDYFRSVNPLQGAYFRIDAPRVAEFYGIPFVWPDPDPVSLNLETRRVDAEQPHIRRLTRLGAAAARRGPGLAFIHEVSRIIWGGVKDWHLGTHMVEAAARAGLDLAELDEEVAADPDGFDAEIAANQAALAAAGHWGVPTLVFEGEPFFGQDRLDICVWRMKQRGLTEREAAGT